MEVLQMPELEAAVSMRRPRLKAEHAPYRISGNRIRIGGVSYGIAAEIEDPAGWVWTLLESLDGRLSPAAVADRVAGLHPGVSPEAARAGLAQLAGSGYLEDAAAEDPPELTERDKERHDRGRGYFRWLDLTLRSSGWEPQVQLRRAGVTIVGLGGTGGVAALALAAAGVGRLHCVDPDLVGLSNLNRQVIYTEDDLGVAKADAAAARLRRLNTDIAVTGQQLRIGSAADMLPLAGSCDVLLLSADQPPEVRSWTNLACITARRPWVDAGYHGPLVQVGQYVPGTGACWQCLRDTALERDTALGVSSADAARRAAAVAAAVGAVPAGMSGYLAAHQVIALLTGVPPAMPGTIQTVNLAALDAPFTQADPPRPGCPACGTRQT